VGTATNTAWKHCPGDPSATGNPASASLTAGDTVVFKGGVSYVLTGISGISLNWSGTAGNPITYDGNSVGTWGTGQAQITDNYGTSQITAFLSPGALGNVTILNFSIGPIGGYPFTSANTSLPEVAPNIGGGIKFAGRVDNLMIANCLIDELGVWQNFEPAGNNSVGNGEGEGIFFAQDFNNITITNCEFTKLQTAITLLVNKTGSNAVVENCYIHDYIRWGIDFPITGIGANMNNIFVHDNRLIDVDKYYSADFWTGYGSSPWHQDGILMRGESVTEGIGGGTIGTFNCGTNIQIYNNAFQDTAEYTGGSSAVVISGGVSANIYNNLFVNLNEANGALSYSEPSPNQHFTFNVLNNTFYASRGILLYWGGIPNGSGSQIWPNNNHITVYNNILYHSITNDVPHWLMVFDATNSTATNCFTFNNNSYHSLNVGGGVNGLAIWSSVYGYLPFSGLQSLGWEANGITSDPLFINAVAADFHLQTNSPAVGAGMNLAGIGLPGLANDKDGNPRPPIGLWTLGAYLPIGSSLVPYLSLVALPSTIISGQSATLTWMSINATNLTLSGTGSVALNGSTIVSPTKTTTYAITAMGTNGTQSADALVLVRPTPPGKPTTQ
jgi:hypothetical protein